MNIGIPISPGSFSVRAEESPVNTGDFTDGPFSGGLSEFLFQETHLLEPEMFHTTFSLQEKKEVRKVRRCEFQLIKIKCRRFDLLFTLWASVELNHLAERNFGNFVLLFAIYISGIPQTKLICPCLHRELRFAKA